MMEAESPSAPQVLFDSGLPLLAICYGQQTMCQELGGVVESGHTREFGRAFVDIKEPCALTVGDWAVGGRQQVWMSHRDTVLAPPVGFDVLGSTSTCTIAAMASPERGLYAVQFHPEVAHTPCGTQIITNFVFGACVLTALAVAPTAVFADEHGVPITGSFTVLAARPAAPSPTTGPYCAGGIGWTAICPPSASPCSRCSRSRG